MPASGQSGAEAGRAGEARGAPRSQCQCRASTSPDANIATRRSRAGGLYSGSERDREIPKGNVPRREEKEEGGIHRIDAEEGDPDDENKNIGWTVH